MNPARSRLRCNPGSEMESAWSPVPVSKAPMKGVLRPGVVLPLEYTIAVTDGGKHGSCLLDGRRRHVQFQPLDAGRWYDGMRMSDSIEIVDLRARTIIGVEEWERREKQDVLVSVLLHTDTRRAGESDDLDQAINYNEVARKILGFADGASCRLIERFAEEVFRYLSIGPDEYGAVSEKFERPVVDKEYFMEMADRFRSPHIWKFDNGAWSLRHALLLLSTTRSRSTP